MYGESSVNHRVPESDGDAQRRTGNYGQQSLGGSSDLYRYLTRCHHPRLRWDAIADAVAANPTLAQYRDPLSGATPLHVLCCLQPDVPLSTIYAVVDAHPSAITTVDCDGRTPLHNAMAYFSTARPSCHDSRNSSADAKDEYDNHDASVVPMIRRLAGSGYDMLDGSHHFSRSAASMADMDGNFPLHLACSNSLVAPAVVHALLDLCPHVVLCPNYAGSTPIDIATFEISSCRSNCWGVTVGAKDLEKVQYLVHGARYGILPSYRHPCCVDHHHAEEHCQEQGQDDPHPEEGANFTTLHSALAVAAVSSALSLAVVNVIASLFEDEAHVADKTGRLPLSYAAALRIFPASRREVGSGGCIPGDVMPEQQHQQRRRRRQRQTQHIESGNSLLPETDGDADNMTEFYQQEHERLFEIINSILSTNPRAASVSDHEGRVPLHYALDPNSGCFKGQQLPWRFGGRLILHAAPSAVHLLDPKTGLYPFMLVASGRCGGGIGSTVGGEACNGMVDDSGLEAAFDLLSECPHLVPPTTAFQ